METEKELINYVEFVDGHREKKVTEEEAAKKVEKAMDKGEYVMIEDKKGKTTTSEDIKREAKKEAKKEAKGDKKKEKALTKQKKKEKTKKALGEAKTVKQIKPPSGG